jgi:hypothetical protein
MDHMGKHIERRGKYTEGRGTHNYYGTEKVYIFHLTYGQLKLSQLPCPNGHVISIRHSQYKHSLYFSKKYPFTVTHLPLLHYTLMDIPTTLTSGPNHLTV